MSFPLPASARLLFVHPQTMRIVGAVCALAFLLSVVSAFLVVRYLGDSASLRESLNRSYEIRQQTGSILALLDQAIALRASMEMREDGYRAERFQDAIRVAGQELARIEKALADASQPKASVADLVTSLRTKMSSFDERQAVASPTDGVSNESVAERRRRMVLQYDSMIADVRAAVASIRAVENTAVESQIVDDRKRAFWGQVFVIMILSGIMLAIVIAATLVVLLLPDAPEDGAGLRRH